MTTSQDERSVLNLGPALVDCVLVAGNDIGSDPGAEGGSASARSTQAMRSRIVGVPNAWSPGSSSVRAGRNVRDRLAQERS